MSQNIEQQGNVTRRGLVKLATGLITSIPVIGGKLVLPIEALAEEKKDEPKSEDYGVTAPQSAKDASAVVTKNTYEVKSYWVYYRVCDMGETNEFGRPKAVPNARVTLMPFGDGEALMGFTDNVGIVAFDIKNVADNPNEEDPDSMTSYNLTGTILVNAEGYRTFETGLLDIRGGKASSLPLHKLTEGLPYPHQITYNLADVLYTACQGTIYNNAAEGSYFHVDFRNVKGDTATISLKAEGVREPIRTQVVRVKSGQAACDLSGYFEQQGHQDQLPAEKYIYIVITADNVTYSVGLSIVFFFSPVGDESYTQKPVTGNMPMTTNNKNGQTPFAFTFPESVPVLGNGLVKMSNLLPDWPIKIFFDPSGYVQLTLVVATKPIAKYDSAKDLKSQRWYSQQRYTKQQKNKDGSPKDEWKDINNDGGWDIGGKWGGFAGIVTGDTPWSKINEAYYDAWKNKWKNIQAAGAYLRHPIATNYIVESYKVAYNGAYVNLNGEKLRQIYTDENGGQEIVAEPLDWGRVNVDDYEVIERPAENQQPPAENPAPQAPQADVEELAVNSHDQDEEQYLMAQLEASKPIFVAQLQEMIEDGLMPYADESDLVLLAQFCAQANALGAFEEEYEDTYLDDDADSSDVMRAIALARIDMLKDDLDKKRRYTEVVLRMSADDVSYSTQANEEGVRYELPDYQKGGPCENFYADFGKNRDPWHCDKWSNGFSPVPFAPGASGLKKWGHIKFNLTFNCAIEGIGKWSWPNYVKSKTDDTWSYKHGSILLNARINFTFSLSLSYSMQWVICWIPIVATLGLDVTLAVLVGLAAIRQFRYEDLGVQDPETTNYQMFSASNWEAFFRAFFDFHEYEMDYATEGLVVTLTFMPYLSFGLGFERWQLAQAKFRGLLTIIFSATAVKYAEDPQIREKDADRWIVTLDAGVQFNFDFLLFTFTKEIKWFPWEGRKNKNVLKDTWGMKEEADESTGEFVPTTFSIPKSDFSKMSIVSNEMISLTSEMSGEQALEEQSDEYVFDWEDAREDDYVSAVSNGTNISYKVFRMPEYDDEVLDAQDAAVALGEEAVGDTVELGGKAEVDAQSLSAVSAKTKPRLRRTSTVMYTKNATGLMSMSDGNNAPDPGISGLGNNGYLNPVDQLLTPDKPVQGDPHMKVLEYATIIAGPSGDANDEMGVTVTAVFRLCSVEIAGKPRTRILMSLLDARDMNGERLSEDYQYYLTRYDKVVIDFDVNDIKGMNRSDMYDYGFDVTRKTIVEGGDDTLGSDMLQIVVVSGVRNEGDDTGVFDAATTTVFTYLTIPVENLFLPQLVYDMKISIKGDRITTNEGKYHLIKDITIQGGEGIDDKYAIVAFQDRASNTAENVVGSTTREVTIGIGFMLVDFQQKCFLIPDVENVALGLGAHANDPRITQLSLSPKINDCYLLGLLVNAGQEEASLTHYFLLQVPDEQDPESGYFTFSKLQYVTSDTVKLVPCPARNCFFAAYEDPEAAQDTQEFLDYGQEIKQRYEETGDESVWDEYDNGTIYGPDDYEKYLKQFDKKRELHRVWFEGVDSDAPVLKHEKFGSKALSVQEFGFNTNATFIFWPEMTHAVDEGGYPLYDVDENTGEYYVAERHSFNGMYVFRACRIHENLAGEVTFSEPFVIGEVNHEVTDVVVASARNKYSPLTLLSKEKATLQNEVGDDYFGKNGLSLYPACNIYYTAIPNVNCAIVDDCCCMSEYVVPGCNAIFEVFIRNAGNTYLSGCTIELCLHTVNDEGEEVVTKIEGTAAELVFDSDTLVESDQNAADETGSYTNIEDDWSLAPGQKFLYRVSVPIPDSIEGEFTISAIASKPVMAEHGGLSGLVDDDEEFEYVDYEVQPGEYKIYSYKRRTSPYQDAKRTYMTRVNFTYNDNNDGGADLRDAPVKVGDASIVDESAEGGISGTSGANANGGASGGAGAANGVNASGGAGAVNAAYTAGGANRQATAKTADATSGVLPAALATMGAAALAYERRRAKNEDAAQE